MLDFDPRSSPPRCLCAADSPEGGPLFLIGIFRHLCGHFFWRFISCRLLGRQLPASATRKHGPPNDEYKNQASGQRFKEQEGHSTSNLKGRRQKAIRIAIRKAYALLSVATALTLAACSNLPSPPVPTPPPPVTKDVQRVPDEAVALDALLAEVDALPLPPAQTRARSLWQPVRWREVPGLGQDQLHALWNAWIRSCERPQGTWQGICREVRPLALASAETQWTWLLRRFQAYRVSNPDGSTPAGLLTGYYEPVLSASRLRTATHTVPLHGAPARLPPHQAWFSRQEIDTLPAAQTQLAGRELVWLSDPIDALILQIQGSGRILVREPDGQERTIRLAFAAHNGHPYKSVGRWLLDQRAITDPSWASIKQWAIQNPTRVNEMLWSNPRTVFFREEPLDGLDAQFGPKGAQGVPLTPERSIAVDSTSIPYGTPVWLATQGPTLSTRRLVMAQDTGGAIVGAVRADYFTGWGPQAAQMAGGLKQALQLWVLWPR